MLRVFFKYHITNESIILRPVVDKCTDSERKNELL